MLLTRNGDSMVIDGVTYTIGARVHANDCSDYAGFDGVITEIRADADMETENEGADIYCAFDIPDDPKLVAELEQRFSRLYQSPMTLDEVGLDMVIMAPDMIDVLEPEQTQNEGPQLSPSL